MPVEFSQPDVRKVLEQRDFAALRRLFADLEPADVASTIETLDSQDRAVVFRMLRRGHAADTFEHLSQEFQEGLIKSLADEEVARILNDMSPDDRTQFLEELPASVTKQVLSLLSPAERAIATRLLGYPEDSIGRLMTPEFISVHVDWTVQQALDHIRRYGKDSETLNVISVVDDKDKLIDDLRMRQLLLADPTAPISSIIDGNFIALTAADDQERAVQVFKEYDRAAFPVTDSRGVLLGIVTWDDVFEVAVEEATEDIHKIGGSEALDQPYMRVGFVEMFRKRAPWLVLLFLGQQLTMVVMALYTAKLEQAIVLAVFVPLILSSGGNSGSQAATLVIRAMALDEIALADWWRVMRREILFGLALGGTFAGIGYLRVALGAFGDSWGLLAIAIGVSLIGVVLWGVLIGSMLPFILRRLGADPATSSTPFVATICDVTGLMLYLTIATRFL